MKLVHPALQTIRGMCADEASHGDIDCALALAVEMAKSLEDRVVELEAAMAAEARIIEVQALGLKALGQGRRRILGMQVERMRRCSLGGKGRHNVTIDWRERTAAALEALCPSD